MHHKVPYFPAILLCATSLTQLCSFADRVFRSDCNTKEVYEEGAKAVALSVVSGINCKSTPASYLSPFFFESKYSMKSLKCVFFPPLFVCYSKCFCIWSNKQWKNIHHDWNNGTYSSRYL